MLESYRVILASNSPRRKELLTGVGVSFEVMTIPGIDESFPDTLKGGDIPLFLARKKCDAYQDILRDNVLVITADTIVWQEGKVVTTTEVDEGEITENYFDGIDWIAEIDNVANALAEISDLVETFGVRYHILSLEGLKEFASTAKDFTIYNEEDYFNDVAEILVAISESKALAAELEFAQFFLI